MIRFERFELRTVDEHAARAFYDDLLEDGCPDVSPLPEPARARGLPPQWLGHVTVPDVGAALAAWVARGAVLRGPPPSPALPRAVIHDPGGAMLALSAAPTAARRADVMWHQLVTREVTTAERNYTHLCGWALGSTLAVDGFGPVREFAFAPGEAPAGSLASVEPRRGVHPQWLYFFRAMRLDLAIDRVRERGGSAFPPLTLASGARCAVCEDPQGGAFGLMEPAP